MKKALITGVTGQDGAYLSKLLLSKNYEVYGISPRRSSNSDNRLSDLDILQHKNFSLLKCDITDQSHVFRIVESIQPDEVYNLAAQSFVKLSFDSPVNTLTVNTIGTVNMLEAVRKYLPNARFYQASTSEMFGLVNVTCQFEDTPFHPRSPYGVSKVAAHQMCVHYREAYDMRISCGILFNHESPLRGFEFVTRKITDGVAKIVAGKSDELLLGNMDAIRDWGHAEDYVYGMWLMLQQDNSSDYVLATGESHSVRQFCDLAFKTVGLDMNDFVKQDKRFMRPSDVPILLGNPDKAEYNLGWERSHDFGSLVKEMMENDLSLIFADTELNLLEKYSKLTGTVSVEVMS